ncbi:MAG: T9SS type A sorting domain-containing protein [Bacteroidetes bacterium]|nr:T9SS type A sorting domain-containing protein [Bacteroidota bacterium]MBL7104171.1 T9SS type A sorting domain-containing protein [Bacteroidales bacterium]
MKTITFKYLHLICTFIFILFIFHLSFSQSNMSIQWQGCYGGSEKDVAYDICEYQANGYLISGKTGSQDGDVSFLHGNKDIWLARIDSIGNILWERSYGGSSYDMEGKIIQATDGNFYICGAVSSYDGDVQSGNHGDYDVWVVKIDQDGEIIWEKCYGGSGREDFTNIKLLNNGNLLISCSSTSDDGDLPAHYHAYDAWLFVISPYGEILKSAVFGNELHNNVYDAIETQDGGFFFTCGASSTEGMVEGTYHGGMLDIWVVKLDNNMNIEWQKLYGGSDFDSGSRGIIELLDGYIFLGVTNSNDQDVSGFHGGEGEDIWAVRIDTEGNIIWQRCLGGGDWEFTGDLHQTDDGGFIIFGSTLSHGGDVSGNNSWSGNSDIWIVKLSTEGELLWQECFGGYGNEGIIWGTIKKSDNNWVVAGWADNNSYDVSCNLHGYKEDYWVFEIEDTSTNIINTQTTDNAIKVYPNPATDYVVFEFSSSVISNCWAGQSVSVRNPPAIQITNIFGQMMAELPIKNEKTVWDIREVSGGTYFYCLQSGLNAIERGKIIILK